MCKRADIFAFKCRVTWRMSCVTRIRNPAPCATRCRTASLSPSFRRNRPGEARICLRLKKSRLLRQRPAAGGCASCMFSARIIRNHNLAVNPSAKTAGEPGLYLRQKKLPGRLAFCDCVFVLGQKDCSQGGIV